MITTTRSIHDLGGSRPFAQRPPSHQAGWWFDSVLRTRIAAYLPGGIFSREDERECQDDIDIYSTDSTEVSLPGD